MARHRHRLRWSLASWNHCSGSKFRCSFLTQTDHIPLPGSYRVALANRDGSPAHGCAARVTSVNNQLSYNHCLDARRIDVVLDRSLLNNLTSVQKQFPKDSDAYLANSPHTILKVWFRHPLKFFTPPPHCDNNFHASFICF